MSARTMVSRRSLLGGLAASSVAAVAAADAPEPNAAENPVLVALGDDLPGFTQAMTKARKAKERAYSDAMANWPEPPESITLYLPRRGFLLHDYERDVAGAAINEECPERGYKHVISAKFFASRIVDAEASLAAERRRKKPRKSQIEASMGCLRSNKPKLADATAYEAKCKSVKEASRYDSYSDECTAAREDLRTHIDAIMSAPAETMLGVLIKAEALRSWQETEYLYQLANKDGAAWAAEMSKAVIEQAGGVAHA